MLTLADWRATWNELGLICPDAEFVELQERYREPQRAYHTWQHLEECFEHFESVPPFAEQPAEVELALWYHDAVYDPRRHDNEERSCDLAVAAMELAGGSPELSERISSLILATRHAETPTSRDAQLVVDVDLAILAAEPERFDEYERQVRQEYAWVPWPDYVAGRSMILTRFLERPRIFATDWFHERFEDRARTNLQESVRRMRGQHASSVQSSP
jgi:predicted metal-dependent HD superfamily phosphohydrolase